MIQTFVFINMFVESVINVFWWIKSLKEQHLFEISETYSKCMSQMIYFYGVFVIIWKLIVWKKVAWTLNILEQSYPFCFRLKHFVIE